MTTIPAHLRSDIDLFEDAVLDHPYPAYKTLRDLGPAAYLNKFDTWFLGRFMPTRQALADWQTFSSAQGIGMNPMINEAWKDALICVDPPKHTELRKLITDRLGPRHLQPIEDTIDRRANELADELVKRGSFDAVKELAEDLPINIIMDLIGWPEDIRARLLKLADGSFDPCGPVNARTQAAMPQLGEIYQLVSEVYDSNTLTPGGFGATVADAARQGNIPRETAIGMLLGYVVAAFDTTISAVASGVWLFAKHPEQWQLLRDDLNLVTSAFNEIVRLETPIQHFTRVTTKDVGIGEGVIIPKDSRVVVSYAAANRDERQFPDPDKFDITRRSPHLGFGGGVHSCAGQNLARLEGHAIFKALAQRVEHFELIEPPTRRLYNVTRSFSRVPTKAHAG